MRPDSRHALLYTSIATAILGALCCVPATPAHAQTDVPTKTRSSESTDTTDGASDTEPTSLEVETTVDTGESVQVPVMPSGFTTRLTPGDTFTEGDDLAGLLESAAGVTVQRQSGPGHPAYLSLRGGNPRQTTVLLNGIRISAPAGLGFDVGTFSTTFLDSIEVRRGASAIIDGSGALTGSLHLTAHAPSKPGNRLVSRAIGGSFGTAGLSTTASLTNQSDSSSKTNSSTEADPFVSGEVTGGLRSSRGDFQFIDNQGTVRRRTNNDVQSGHLFAATHAQYDDSTVDTAILVESDRRGAPGSSEFQSQFRRARIHNRRAIATTQWSSTGVASGQWGVADASAHLGYVNRSLDYTNPESLLGDRSVRNETDWRSLSAGTDTSILWDAGIISHLTLDTRLSNYSATYSDPNSDPIDASRQTVGLGLSNEILLFDDEVSLVAAARTEFIHGDRTDIPFMPAAGVIWRPYSWLTTKANLAYSHRVPDFDELYLKTGAVEGNPDLLSERSLGWDIGAVADSDDFPVGGGATFFQNDFYQTIRFVPVSAYRVRARNLGGASSRGLELFANLKFRQRVHARAGYTWTDASLDTLPDRQIIHQPEHRARLDATLHLGDFTPFNRRNALQLTTSGHYRGRVNLDNFGNLTNPPYIRVDAGVTVSPEPWIRLGFNVRNVTNYRRGADSLQRPLPGRAYYGSLRLKQTWHSTR